MIAFRLSFVEFCRNPSEISHGRIPVYVLYLFPYYAIISLQNLYVLGVFIKKAPYRHPP